MSGLLSIFVAQVFTVCTINIRESVSFELWIFATSSTLEMRCKFFFNQPNGWGKLTQWLGKLGILGKNLGVKASPRYIHIRGITGGVLTRLTCSSTFVFFLNVKI